MSDQFVEAYANGTSAKDDDDSPKIIMFLINKLLYTCSLKHIESLASHGTEFQE